MASEEGGLDEKKSCLERNGAGQLVLIVPDQRDQVYGTNSLPKQQFQQDLDWEQSRMTSYSGAPWNIELRIGLRQCNFNLNLRLAVPSASRGLMTV